MAAAGLAAAVVAGLRDPAAALLAAVPTSAGASAGPGGWRCWSGRSAAGSRRPGWLGQPAGRRAGRRGSDWSRCAAAGLARGGLGAAVGARCAGRVLAASTDLAGCSSPGSATSWSDRRAGHGSDR